MKRTMICLGLLVAFVVTVAQPADVLASTETMFGDEGSIDNMSRAEKRAARQAARKVARKQARVAASAQTALDSEFEAMLDSVNADLAATGVNYRAAMVEYVTGDVDAQGNTVIAKNVGNKRLAFDFVPFDARRTWSGPTGATDDITYAIDTTGDAVPFAGGLTGAMTDAAIVRGHNSWEALTCSILPQARNPDFGIDIGLVAFCLSGGAIGSPFAFADVQHAGWRDLNFGGGTIGATFTFGFIDVSQLPAIVFTDIDNNGRLDTALREIYYDPFDTSGAPRVWANDGVTNIDVETVAAHEIGHGLSQAHFGKVFIDNKGNLKFAPKAIMNAVYVGPQRLLLGTDKGGHCDNWANWPNN